MAPVGSRESLAAAIHAGADSIYFGIESLNMRARSASTFTIDDLREIARTCDENGVKSYLTVNTIIYDEDIELMRKIIDAAKEAGISAVIASDVAVMAYCNQVGQEVHLSTQLNISNAEALKFYARFADVVVLARELNLKQVRKIYDAIQEQHIMGPMGKPVRIEMFCHGALCMAVSGKCYLSLNEQNASANRGACMQVCHHVAQRPEDHPLYGRDDRSGRTGVQDRRPCPRTGIRAHGGGVLQGSHPIRYSTAAFGTVITWGNAWANGAAITVRKPPSARSMPDGASSISRISAWRSS